MPKSILHTDKPTIIISRTDNIGDVVLTLPLAKYIKHKYPKARVLFLAKKYLRPLIEACEYIDEFIDQEEISSLPETFMQVDFFKAVQADAIIHVFPNHEMGLLARRAAIPYRIGTSHRSYHWLYCNKLINFSRKRSHLHEAQLNFKLLAPLGIGIPELAELKTAYGLNRIPNFKEEDILDKNRFNLIIHPKSRGSGREWDWENYNKLVEILPTEKFKIFVTGTEEEGRVIREKLLKNHPSVTDMTGKQDFSQLLAFISQADGLVASGTGPLHLAAAMGKRAVGLFPPMKPIHPGRWAPLGPNAAFLVLSKDCTDCKKGGHCACINSIKAEQVKELLAPLIPQRGN
jgi:heptosyltransferase-3